MSKTSKHKKNKVPKITEEEYAAYVSALKSSTAGALPNDPLENVSYRAGMRSTELLSKKQD
jgi:hypothetical protein